MIIIKAILRGLLNTLILLGCTVLQVFEAIFMGIGMVFEGCANILDEWSAWLMKQFDKGKYESEAKITAE